MEQNFVNLTRDCDAMLIPAGTKVTLAEGTRITITHKLGGNFTITGAFGMARVEGKDADAIEEVIPQETLKFSSNTPKPSSEYNETEEETPTLQTSEDKKFDPPEESELWDAARTVYDPEIPLNIVELGLVYRMDLISSSNGKYAVEVDMTLTAPGCAMGPIIAEDLKLRLKAIPGVDDAIVNIVWDPPWSQDMITEEGKMTLGLL